MPSSPTHKNLSSLIEQPDSKAFKIGGGKATYTQIFSATLAVCRANVKYEGEAGADTDTTGFVVSACDVTPLGSEQGRLTIVWEASAAGAGATLPPDEVAVQVDNQSPRTERHPIFKPLDGTTIGTGADLKYVMDIVADTDRASTGELRAAARALLVGNTLALLLADKLKAGHESFYMGLLRTAWVKHSWTIPTMTRGGFRQPVQGPLASYFVADIDWLREGDDLQYSSGIWRWTRSWLGAPLPGWDIDLYG